MSYEFADRLTELRRAKGLSQEELAQKIGLSRQAISKWERAESAPDVGNLVALASVYEVTLDDLVRGTAEAEMAPTGEAGQDDAAQNATAPEGEKATEAAGDAATAEEAEADSRLAAGEEATLAEGTPAEEAAAPQPASQAPQAPGPVPATASAYGACPPASVSQQALPPTPEGTAAAPLAPPSGQPVELARTDRRSGWVTLPYPVLVAVVYVALGLCFGLWHPGWVIFFTIPFYYWIMKLVESDPEYIARHSGHVE